MFVWTRLKLSREEVPDVWHLSDNVEGGIGDLITQAQIDAVKLSGFILTEVKTLKVMGGK